MKYFYILLLSLFSFFAQAHVGLPLSEGVKASVVKDGLILENKTGHSLKLHEVRCDGQKKGLIRIRGLAGKQTQNFVNIIIIPHDRKLHISPPNYRIESLQSCNHIVLNFGPLGNYKLK